MNARPIAAGLTIALLAGCASGGSGTALLPGSPSNAVRAGNSDASMKKHRVKGYAHIIIRRPKKKHRGRGVDPRFISSATLGAEFVVTSDAGGSVTTDANLSPASPYCTTITPNVSSCTIPVSMPFGNDTITITTYAQAPSAGGFNPNTELAVGSQTQRVTLGGATPTINVYLSGVVDSIDAGPAFSSLPADGAASSEVFVVNGRDFGNVKIKAGAKDPYSNPITAKLTEHGDGGASHSALQLNGGAPGNKAVLTQSNDSLQLNFDGTGKPGYTAMVKFTANGAPDQTIEISPLYVTATQIRQHVLNLNGAGVPARTMTITETDAPSGTSYTLTRTGCTGIATANGLSGTGSSATFLAQGGATASGNGCVINVADSNSPTAPIRSPRNQHAARRTRHHQRCDARRLGHHGHRFGNHHRSRPQLVDRPTAIAGSHRHAERTGSNAEHPKHAHRAVRRRLTAAEFVERNHHRAGRRNVVNRLDERRSRPHQRFGQQRRRTTHPTKARPESHRPPTARCGSVRVNSRRWSTSPSVAASPRRRPRRQTSRPASCRAPTARSGSPKATTSDGTTRSDWGFKRSPFRGRLRLRPLRRAERQHLVYGQRHEFERGPNHGIVRKLYRQPVQRRSRRELARHCMRRRQRRLVRRQREQRHRPNLSKRRQQPNDLRHSRRKLRRAIHNSRPRRQPLVHLRQRKPFRPHHPVAS